MKLAATKLGGPQRFPTLSQHYGPGVLIAGKYRLEAQIGEGGMGTVWLARNEMLESPVALKLIRTGMQREDTVERLLLEARVEAKLKHPNIVRVFDFGKTELGDAFIVMEMLEGISLAELLRQRTRLDPCEAVQLVLPVLLALCHAHENGVVHRDLKPHNIFLDRGGLHTGTKLLDFGIAKLTGNDTHRHFTLGGTLLGSPAYMAPEQARGLDDVDHRADIWAMCVVLYEAISGAPPFSGEGYVVLRKVIDDEAAALEDTGEGGPGLWRILSRGLEKDPSRRFQSMRELGTALAQWVCDQGESEDLDGNRISRSWGVRSLTLEADASSSGRSYERFHDRSQEVALISEASDTVTGTLRASGVSSRTGALRLLAACVLVIAVIVAASKAGVQLSAQAHAEQRRGGPVGLVPPIQRGPPSRHSPPAAAAPLTRAEATPPKREQPREPRSLRRSTRRPSETDLGLKAAY